MPVLWDRYGGWFSGMAEGLPSKNVEAAAQRRQAGVSRQAGLPIARRLINGKMRDARTLLMRDHRSRNQRVVDSLRTLAADALERVRGRWSRCSVPRERLPGSTSASSRR